MFNSIFIINIGGKLQIIPLKFGGDWILHRKISEFGFYLLKFGDVWILHPNILEFRFYTLKFQNLGV